jgi:hypothetical protein
MAKRTAKLQLSSGSSIEHTWLNQNRFRNCRIELALCGIFGACQVFRAANASPGLQLYQPADFMGYVLDRWNFDLKGQETITEKPCKRSNVRPEVSF